LTVHPAHVPVGARILATRRAGVLLHPTSLPGHPENGDLGHDAFRFIEFLAAGGFSMWQMLPVCPTHDDRSPYAGLSIHAGDPRLISISWLRDRGLLSDRDTAALGDHELAVETACRRLHNHGEMQQAFTEFMAREADWLDDYALFRLLREKYRHQPWTVWPAAARDRHPGELEKIRAGHRPRFERYCFEQFVFASQWRELREHARRHGVLLFGDVPIFVALDSVDVWAHRELFDLDEHGTPRTVAGVPPDYFSATGQYWGNPQYDWQAMEADDFAWWRGRFRKQLERFDVLRVDHFRGFEAVWSIPAGEDTAVNGHWQAVPGRRLLESLRAEFGELPLVAEDLGIITAEVEALRQDFALPGMKILQFAFDGDAQNPYLPHNHEINCVVYTGTHDNNTTLGWYAELDAAAQARVLDYLGEPAADMPWPLNRAALASVANLAILPMQDLLGLDGAHRMNIPGTSEGNWQWRFDWEQVPEGLSGRIRHLLELYGRLVQ